jgi:hypothetical protein
MLHCTVVCSKKIARCARSLTTDRCAQGNCWKVQKLSSLAALGRKLLERSTAFAAYAAHKVKSKSYREQLRCWEKAEPTTTAWFADGVRVFLMLLNANSYMTTLPNF